MEEWFPIKGYEGLYEITKSGKVRNSQNLRQFLGFDNGKGYRYVLLSKGLKKKNEAIHRLVILTFLGECPKDCVVNHKDSNKANNNYENLEYCSVRENTCHAMKDKTIGAVYQKGKWVSQLTHNGKKIYIGSFDTQEEANTAYKKGLENLGQYNRYA